MHSRFIVFLVDFLKKNTDAFTIGISVELEYVFKQDRKMRIIPSV